MTLKEHLKALHEHLAEHHSTKAKHHESLTQHYSRLARALDKSKSDMNRDDEAADCYNDLSECHKALAVHHVMESVHHGRQALAVDAIDDTQKAAGAEDLAKLRPIDGLRVVIPAAPTAAEQVYGTDGLVPVMRAGQPPMGTRADVAPEFEHLIKVSDDE